MRLPLWANPSIDMTMTAVLILTMSYQTMPPTAHYVCGFLLAALLAAHTWLHRRWYASLTRGKWTAFRIFTALVNLALPAAFLVTVASGFLLAFPLPAFRALIAPARTAHLIGSHWALLLTGVHAGLHGSMISSRMQRKCPPRIFRALTAAVYVLALWGAWLFAEQRLYAYLLGTALFTFLDFSKPALLIFAEWGAVILFAAALTHRASLALAKIGKRKSRVIPKGRREK